MSPPRKKPKVPTSLTPLEATPVQLTPALHHTTLNRPKLSKMAEREILKELLQREERLSSRKVASKPSEGDLEKAKQLLKAMFLQQRDFFFDSASEGRLRVGCCTRRSGKTTGAALKFLINLVLNPRSLALYVAKSTTLIRETIWPELKTLVAEYDLPFEFHETQLRMGHTRSTGRVIFRGASDTSQLDKLRGLGVGGNFNLAILDESGHFGAEMEKLVSSVISPSLRDCNGELLLIGTPGYYPEGLFYEASQGLRPNWVKRRWTLQDNPFLKPRAKNLKAIQEDERLTPDDPIFVREYLGEYCLNTKVQMFEYDPARNSFQGLPPVGLTYYLGVDFGWVDETAIVALGWCPTSRQMYAVESWAASEQTADMVAGKLVDFQRKYLPKRIIGDTGGYGKGIAMPIWQDYGIFIEQAQKLEKLNHVSFMNAAFRRGDLFVKLGDPLSAELPKVLWAENKKDAHNRAKDNRSMALLYSWRAANDIAGKTALLKKLTDLPETQGWPEDELLAKLGIDNNSPTNIDWFLKDI